MRYLFSVLVLILLPACDGGGIVPDDDDVVTDDDDAVSGCDAALQTFAFGDTPDGWDDSAPDPDYTNPWEFGRGDRDCPTGERCWATRLRSEYDDCASGRLSSPVLDLSACADEGRTVTMSFEHYYAFEEPSGEGRYWDGGLVQVRGDGGDWQDVDPSPGYDGTLDGNISECEGDFEANGREAWSGFGGATFDEVEIVLPASVLTETLELSFLFGSDRAATDEGWVVDDVVLSAD